jgi:DNA-binding MarR family transcriptional regulator
MGDDVAAVADVIERLTLWMRRRVPIQISTTTVTTLDTLNTAGPLRISDLAEREAISQPGMTTLVNRLAAAGQAERIEHPTDGRATLVRITPIGQQVLADRHRARVEALVRELAHLEVDDQVTLIAALPALTRLISAQHPPLERSVL